jgi:hypothetical protein
MFKKISAFVAAAALAATMTVTAFATNNEDAVKAAKEAGVQANNVQELDNFLQVHKDCFTSEQYDDMISTLNGIRDKYVAPYCKGGEKQVVDKTPAELTEEDKLVVGKNWTDDDRNAIIDSLVNLGKKYDVVVTVTPVDKAHYTVAAEHKHTDSSSSNTDSKGGTNPAGGTTIKSDTPVANTGAAAGESHTAAAVAAVSLAVAGVGAAVIIKKNKE